VTCLGIRFPSGRFHATPWDRHVNEGATEWPISPWRILRALTAALHTRCPEVDPVVARSALGKLTAPPLFTLPPATTGHTRHYLSANGVKRSESALTFDAFVALDRSVLVHVHWPADLTPAESEALMTMARAVSYLGRAESWCEIELMDGLVERPAPNCAPADNSPPPPGAQPVRVLCPNDRMTQADLERTTASFQREGWSAPPGTHWVLYHRAPNALTPAATSPVVSVPQARLTIAEFALGGSILPLFTEAVLVADQFRAAAMRRHGTPSETLAGKSADGERVQRQHDHAHYVPDSRGQTNRVTHVIVYAPRGFSETEQAALARVSFLVQPQDRPALDVGLSGFGDRDDFASATPLFGASTRWRSRSPFVLVRHPRRGKDTPADQVIRELAVRGFPAPEEIIPVSGARLIDARAGDAGLTRWLEFDVTRRGRSHPPGAFGFELVFREPVRGPILLGYGCHYGLGQFEAMK
jgi:CRISPR-associated protein Csb2